MSPAGLVAAAAVCAAVVCCGASFLILRNDREARRTTALRLETAVAAYRPAEELHFARRIPRVRTLLPIARIEGVLGYQRSRSARYRLQFDRVLLLAAFLSLLVGVVACRILGAPGLLASPVAFYAAVRLYYRRADAVHNGKLFNQFPDALGIIVRAVRVGLPLSAAIEVVSRDCQDPTAMEFREAAESVAIGRPLGDALLGMAERTGLTEYRFFASALSLQAQAGGGLTETLDTLADTIRKRVAARLRGHALAAEARTSCYVLGALPFVVGALLFMINPSYMSVLFETTAGLELLGAAAGMLSSGLFVMSWITKRALA